MEKKIFQLDQELIAGFENYLLCRGRAKDTVITYASNLRSFAHFYRDELKKSVPYVLRLQETDVHAFIEYLAMNRHQSPTSLNRTISALRAFAKYALEEKWLKKDITRDLRTYRPPLPPAAQPLSDGDLRRLITAVDLNGRNGLRDLALLQLLLQTGLRVGEISRLIIDDPALNKNQGYLRVRDKKTRSERTVPLNASARHALKKYLETRGVLSGNEPLFLSERNTALSSKSLQHLVKKYLCLAGRSDQWLIWAMPALNPRIYRSNFAYE